ncbi:MAG: hypothetical protein LBQ31_05175 [Bacteroidales bacterium]|nr:hypothetical protein [Bacteroidales bacterium]
MKSLSLGVVRASVSSALAYSRLCSGKPDPCLPLQGECQYLIENVECRIENFAIPPF